MTEKQLEKLREDTARVSGMRLFENETAAEALGLTLDENKKLPDGILVCGIDEAGRGPLAGPVCAAACILPPDVNFNWLNDSKKVSPKKREMLYEEITERAVSWAAVMVSAQRIDEINVLQADYEAMREALSQLSLKPSVLINDAVTIPGVNIPQVPVIKGDGKCISVAAASILAKVTRDRYMVQMDEKYPEYGFAKHKGYGTRQHIAALKKYGPCPIHRRTFIGHFV